jgi:hypothetical protein
MLEWCWKVISSGWMSLVLVPPIVLVTMSILDRGAWQPSHASGGWKRLKPSAKDYFVCLGPIAIVIFLSGLVIFGYTKVRSQLSEQIAFIAIVMFGIAAAIVTGILGFGQKIRWNDQIIEWLDFGVKKKSMRLSEIATVRHNYFLGWSHVQDNGQQRLTIMHSSQASISLLSELDELIRQRK